MNEWSQDRAYPADSEWSHLPGDDTSALVHDEMPAPFLRPVRFDGPPPIFGPTWRGDGTRLSRWECVKDWIAWHRSQRAEAQP